MKKSVLLLPLIALILSSCGSKPEESSSSTSEPTSSQPSSSKESSSSSSQRISSSSEPTSSTSEESSSTPESSSSSSEESSSTSGTSSSEIPPVIEKYTLTFINSENENEKYSVDNIDKGTNYTLTAPLSTLTIPEHKTFDYWKINNETYAVGDTYAVNSDTDVYAMWKYVNQTITFNYGDGSGTTISATAAYGSKYILPTFESVGGQAPQDYFFTGWVISETDYAPGTEIDVTGDITITAKYELDAYVITYVANNGTEEEYVNYLSKSVSDLVLPKSEFVPQAGKAFVGWEYNEVLYADDQKIENVTSNITVTAVYRDIPTVEPIRKLELENLDDENEDKLTLLVQFTTNPDGFIFPASAESRDYDILVAGIYLYEESNGVKTLYPFLYSMPAGTWNSTFDSNSVNWRIWDQYDNDTQGFICNTNSVHFFASMDKWHDPILGTDPYTITVDLNNKDNDTDIFNINKVPGGEYLLSLANYADEHDTSAPEYASFDKWDIILNDEHVEYVNDEEKVTISSNITFKAVWKYVDKYIVSFDTDGGDPLDPVEFYVGQPITGISEPTKTGYSFNGWTPELPTVMPEENIEVKATWTINQYTITFLTDGGSDVDPLTYDYNEEVIAPTDPTKDGYTFAGWSPELPTNMPAENIEVTATWTPNQYTVTLNHAGGTSAQSSVEVTFGEALPDVEVPTKDGHVFMGYYSSSNEQYIGPDGKSVKNWDIDDDNIELTAHWAVTNVVTFNMQGHGEQVATQYVEDGNKVELPTAPSATGYTFGGWFKEAGCTNEWNFDDTIDDDLTLFAKWTVNTYTISYNTNGGEVATSNPTQYNIESTNITLNNPTKDGYVFAGWIGTGLSSLTSEVTISTGSTGDRTYSAVWAIDVASDRVLTFTNSGEGSELLTLYVESNDSLFPWISDFCDGNINSVTGRYIYVNADGELYEYSFTFSLTNWASNFGEDTDDVYDRLDDDALLATVDEVNFTADANSWHKAVIGSNVTVTDLNNYITASNPRVAKMIATDTSDYSLYIVALKTTNPSGFVWPDGSQRVDVTGKYVFVKEDTQEVVSTYNLKYWLGTWWDSHFESNTVNTGFGDEQITGGMHSAVNYDADNWANFTLADEIWQRVILGRTE